MRTIDIITAFIAIDPDTDEGEGIMGTRMPDGSWLPLIGSDNVRTDQIRKLAQQVSRVSGIPHEERSYIRLDGKIKAELNIDQLVQLGVQGDIAAACDKLTDTERYSDTQIADLHEMFLDLAIATRAELYRRTKTRRSES